MRRATRSDLTTNLITGDMIFDPQIPEGTRSVKAMAQLITESERHARILVVDDDLSNLNVVTQILRRAGFVTVHGIAQAEEVVPSVIEFEPDIVLLDLHMPGADGLQLIAHIGAIAGQRNYLPVLILTGDSSYQARDAALAAGAKDFLTKPYEPTEIVLRVRNLIETRLLYVELQRQNALLTERFVARTEELEAAKLEILERLARASDFRDDATFAHTERVGELAAHIGKQLGLAEGEIELLRIAARLHDIGKIGVSDTILLKCGPLATAEFIAQEKHTLIGANILAGSRFPVLNLAEMIALTHHEAWDGSGYPRGLSGEEIPLVGRIVAVADVFDALTHARPYKQAWEADTALREIRSQSGRKFDPRIVDALVTVMAGSPNFEPEINDSVSSYTHTERARIVRDVMRERAL